MAFTLMKFEDILKMTKEAVDATLAPVRARAARARFDGKAAELEEKQIKAETAITEVCAQKELNIDKLLDALDDLALVERRIKQINDVRAQMFPDSTT